MLFKCFYGLADICKDHAMHRAVFSCNHKRHLIYGLLRVKLVVSLFSSLVHMRHFGNLILRRAFVSKASKAPRSSTAPVIPTMRDYQRECVQICLDSLAQGARKQVVSLPVGESCPGWAL